MYSPFIKGAEGDKSLCLKNEKLTPWQCPHFFRFPGVLTSWLHIRANCFLYLIGCRMSQSIYSTFIRRFAWLTKVLGRCTFIICLEVLLLVNARWVEINCNRVNRRCVAYMKAKLGGYLWKRHPIFLWCYLAQQGFNGNMSIFGLFGNAWKHKMRLVGV